MTDLRIVYGATCLWWDTIDKAGIVGNGLPSCPICSGVLFEVDTEAWWWHGVQNYENKGHTGYKEFIEWLRGKCFKGKNKMTDALKAYTQETTKVVQDFPPSHSS